MPDYIYLLENRLSADQQNALRQLREAAREAGMILFLTGDAVRDLTSGHAVRDLEAAVHGNALKLKKTIEQLGGKVWGEDEALRSLYLCFPGTVRVDLTSTQRVEYPSAGKPVFHPASIQEDLRRRDFTVNAMAISLNEGSYGLLIDPLNGAADIEARTLRLVSNYGFLEDPSLPIRATRYRARLGWELDSKTKTRYENAIAAGVVEALSAEARSRELEQIGHEDEGLKVLRALEAEGWMKVLFPAWTSAMADEEKLKALHDLAAELLQQGVHADMSAAQMRLLTAGLAPKELASLKKLMLRPGFVEEWNSLDALAAGFASALLAEENAIPSASYRLFTTYDPEAILWLGFTSDAPAIRECFNRFLKVWPEVRQRIPHAAMQEMRITPELAAYREIVHSVFLELIDGRLATPEEVRAFLEPHSPPAPPPRETVKRPRAKRGGEAKLKEHSYEDDEESEGDLEEDEDLDDIGGDEDEIDLRLNLPKVDLDLGIAEEAEPLEDEPEGEEPETVLPPVTHVLKAPASRKPAGEERVPAPVPAEAQAVEASIPGAARLATESEKGKKSTPASKPKSGPKSGSKPAPDPQPGPVAETKTVAPAAKPVAIAAEPTSAAAQSKPAPVAENAPPSQGGSKGSLAAKPAVPLVAPKKEAAAVPVKAPAKAAVKTSAQPPAKPQAKAAAKAAPASPPPAKGKPAPAASSKPDNAPPSKQAEKKPAPKPAKKR